MKQNHILISIGFIVYILLSSVDKFIYHIPNMIYIPTTILAIIFILIGGFLNKK